MSFLWEDRQQQKLLQTPQDFSSTYLQVGSERRPGVKGLYTHDIWVQDLKGLKVMAGRSQVESLQLIQDTKGEEKQFTVGRKYWFAGYAGLGKQKLILVRYGDLITMYKQCVSCFGFTI